MRHICIYKCIVNHWNAFYPLWFYFHIWTVLFFVVAVVAVAWTSSEWVAAAATAARHYIWSPGVSVASISQYLIVFYYKLFYESTLIKEYITWHSICPFSWSPQCSGNILKDRIYNYSQILLTKPGYSGYFIADTSI